MIDVINEFGILIFIAMTSVLIIGFSGLFYLVLLAVTLVFRETLKAFGVFSDFVRWRNIRRIHGGKPKKEDE